jgi:hypothetical protein
LSEDLSSLEGLKVSRYGTLPGHLRIVFVGVVERAASFRRYFWGKNTEILCHLTQAFLCTVPIQKIK